MPGSHRCMQRHIPKMSPFLYLHCPGMVFGRVSPQLPTEPDNHGCCTMHTGNWHVVKGLLQPGSQLKNWRHTKLPAQMSEASEKKGLRKWWVSFGRFKWDLSFIPQLLEQASWCKSHNFTDLPQQGVSQQLQIRLAPEVQRSFICLWP